MKNVQVHAVMMSEDGDWAEPAMALSALAVAQMLSLGKATIMHMVHASSLGHALEMDNKAYSDLKIMEALLKNEGCQCGHDKEALANIHKVCSREGLTDEQRLLLAVSIGIRAGLVAQLLHGKNGAATAIETTSLPKDQVESYLKSLGIDLPKEEDKETVH